MTNDGIPVLWHVVEGTLGIVCGFINKDIATAYLHYMVSLGFSRETLNIEYGKLVYLNGKYTIEKETATVETVWEIEVDGDVVETYTDEEDAEQYVDDWLQDYDYNGDEPIYTYEDHMQRIKIVERDVIVA